ncbi:MAG: ABC transporter permease [Nitriliruptor sp.]|nr:MAG: ABC transporter permease [Nitriliruptor sp.]
MQGFLRSRKVIGVFIAVIAVHVLLGVATFGPSTSAELSDVPVGVLDLDRAGLAEELTATDVHVIEWMSIASDSALREALDDKEIAAGLVIPAGATETLAALGSEQPEPVVLDLYVNHGRNPQAAQTVQATILALAEGAAAELSTQTLAALGEADVAVAPDAVATLAQPIQVETIPVNAPSGAADAQTPLVLVAMLWIGSLIATLVSWLGLHRKDTTPRGFLGAQLIVVAALAVLQPLSIVAVGNWLLGMDITLTASLFGALALTTALFFLLQSAVLNWLGFGGWPILVLLWLFSFTLLSVPAEALASGYRVLIHSWLPSRFPYEALQGIVHFDGAGQAGPMLAISAAIALGALALLLASYHRLRGRDLSVNPIAARVAKVGDREPAETEAVELVEVDPSGDRQHSLI